MPARNHGSAVQRMFPASSRAMTGSGPRPTIATPMPKRTDSAARPKTSIAPSVARAGTGRCSVSLRHLRCISGTNCTTASSSPASNGTNLIGSMKTALRVTITSQMCPAPISSTAR